MSLRNLEVKTPQRLTSVTARGVTSKVDRASGCLMGMVVGDAFGSRYEFSGRADACAALERERKKALEREALGRATKRDSEDDKDKNEDEDNRERTVSEKDEMKKMEEWRCPDILGGGPFSLSAGQVTDDSEMGLALAHSLARCGTYDVDDVAQSYVMWNASDPFDRGDSIENALEDTDVNKRASKNRRAMQRAARKHNTDSMSNGVLMRVAPLAIAGCNLDANVLRGFCHQEAALTHSNPAMGHAVAAFVMALRTGILCGGDRLRMYKAACDEVRTTAPEIYLVLQNARRRPEEARYKTDGEHLGYAGVALQNAFYELLCENKNGFAGAIESVVRRGGDTDTTVAITGALLGTVYGLSAIPQKWRDTLAVAHKKSSARERHKVYPWADCSAIPHLAKRLYFIHSDHRHRHTSSPRPPT